MCIDYKKKNFGFFLRMLWYVKIEKINKKGMVSIVFFKI